MIPEIVHPLLTDSFQSAQAAGVSSPVTETETEKGQEWVSFDRQQPVGEREQVWNLEGGLFLGSSYGASNIQLFQNQTEGGLGIQHVINLTAGSHKCPNRFKDMGINYLDFEIHDQPGEVSQKAMMDAFERGFPVLEEWLTKGDRVLVHCMAGLSRSATFVVAFLMRTRRWTLKRAVDYVEERRGRGLQCNPTFWMILAQEERRLFQLSCGSVPSVDFRLWWREDFGQMGFTVENIDKALIQAGDWVDFHRAFEALLQSTDETS